MTKKRKESAEAGIQKVPKRKQKIKINIKHLELLHYLHKTVENIK